MPAVFIDGIIKRYEGTRIGRQELHAELLGDVPGALWPYETILAARIASHPDLQRVVVAVDPSGSSGSDDGDEQGIVVAGLGVDGLGYVLADRTCRLSPQGWGRRAIEAFDAFGADKIVAEKNYGGEMVRFTIQAVRSSAPVSLVTASRGKIVRAEPVSALYEQGRIRHLIPDLTDNPLAELERELRHATSNGYLGEGSPNRMDALVWALTELFLSEPVPGGAFLVLARRELVELELAKQAGRPDPLITVV
jgi:phage terminase large subunit-like protein